MRTLLLLCLCTSSAWANDGRVAARLAAAELAHQDTVELWKSGQATPEQVYVWSVRWLEAEKAHDGADALAKHLARMRGLQASVNAQYAQGMASAADTHYTAFYVAEAEVWATPPAPLKP